MTLSWFTCADAAEYLRFRDRSSIRKLVKRGELRPDGRGPRGCHLFRRETLDAWVLPSLSSGLGMAVVRPTGGGHAGSNEAGPGPLPDPGDRGNRPRKEGRRANGPRLAVVRGGAAREATGRAGRRRQRGSAPTVDARRIRRVVDEAARAETQAKHEGKVCR